MASQTYEADVDEEGSVRVVFVTDAAEEGSRIADTLRVAGYVVVDVPLSMLVARAAVQRPDVVLLDVDAKAALEELVAFRRVPGSTSTAFVYIGGGAGPIRSARDAIAHEGSAFFRRPIDVGALVDHIAVLTGGPPIRSDRRSPPPPSALSSLPPPRLGSVPPDRPSAPSLPAPGARTSGPPLPMSVPSLSELGDPPSRSLATLATVSSELAQLLADAEVRAEQMLHAEAPLPSPEEEIESVLPADVLASLDEPLEGDEDDGLEPRAGGEHHDRDGGAFHAKATTSGGSKLTTSAGRTGSQFPRERRPANETPAWDASADRHKTGEWSPRPERSVEPRPPLHAVSEEAAPASLGAEVEVADVETARPAVLPSIPPSVVRPSQAPVRGGSEAPARISAGSIVVHEAVDARRFFAEAIAARRSGSLCFEHEGVVRRVVLRDGDLVTAASGAESESLVCFLGERGELPREEVERLSGKIPPYGRHAGAALVAHGWLGQDQLWSALRAHAEWIAATVLGLAGGTAQLEPEPPGRLRSEPSVFAAKAGAEIFIELVRRVVSPEEAIEALGGDASRIGDGATSSLLGECALVPQELELVTRSRGGTVGELAMRSPVAEILAVVHGLHLLGVLDIIVAIDRADDSRVADIDAESAALDEEATRARIRARLELVDEGDYFSLLGVRREATSYEVRRAFIELRRTFEPTRIITPRTMDLTDDVRKIVVVLEEAYEILRDSARRERYRRAIEARPA